MSHNDNRAQRSTEVINDEDGHVVPIESPLMRINADNQEPVRFWFLWIGLFVVMLLIVLLVFALPPVFKVLTNDVAFRNRGINCDNPLGFTADGSLYCGDYNNANPTVGLVARQLDHLNQFAFIYLELLPKNGEHLPPKVLNQDAQLQAYQLNIEFHNNSFSFKRGEQIYNQTIKLVVQRDDDEDDDDDDDDDDDRRLLMVRMLDGHDDDDDDDDDLYEILLGFMRQFEEKNTSYFLRLTFTQPIQLEPMRSVELKGFTLTKQFTNFTIAIRYVYFCISLISGIIFIRRYLQLPQTERILQIKFIALGSVFLWMFNDPFYPITILKPNKASAFFSVIFVSFFVISVLLIWVFFLRRIKHEQGQKSTKLLTFKRTWWIIGYTAIFYIFILVVFIDYSMMSVDQPIIPGRTEIKEGIIAVAVLAVIMLFIAGIYILVNYIIIICHHCKNPGFYMWRHLQLIKMLPAFLILFIASAVGLGFAPYSYSAEWILYGYSFMNIQMYLLQYLYYTPKVEVQQRQRDIEIFSDNYTLKSDISIEEHTRS